MPTKKVGQLAQVNISIAISAVLLIGGAAFVGVFIIFEQHRELVKFVAAVVGGGTAIYSAYFVGLGLRLKLDQERKERTFKQLAELSREDSVRVRKWLEQKVGNQDSVAQKELYRQVIDDEQLLGAITTLLSVFEDIALAIKHEHLDEEVLHESIAYMVQWHYQHLRFYMDQHRAATGRDTLFSDFEALYRSWREGKRLSDGKSFRTVRPVA